MLAWDIPRSAASNPPFRPLRMGWCRLDSAPITSVTAERGGLKAELRGMSQANVDLGILQETKLTDGVYTRGSAGYNVIATDVPSRHRGGVTQ